MLGVRVFVRRIISVVVEDKQILTNGFKQNIKNKIQPYLDSECWEQLETFFNEDIFHTSICNVFVINV